MGTNWKTKSGGEVLAVHWFTQFGVSSVTGIVLVQFEGYKVAYIGAGPGFTEPTDAISIAETSGKLKKETAQAEFNGFDLSDYKER